MRKIYFLPKWIVNSSFWYRIYYRHTKKCKSERKETRDRALAIRKKVIGK